MTPRIMIDFDDLTDVVVVQRDGAAIVKARPAPHDNHLMFELDASGAVVGIEVMGASDRVPSFWRGHPDRGLVPAEILSEADRWLAHLWADLGRGLRHQRLAIRHAHAEELHGRRRHRPAVRAPPVDGERVEPGEVDEALGDLFEARRAVEAPRGVLAPSVELALLGELDVCWRHMSDDQQELAHRACSTPAPRK